MSPSGTSGRSADHAIGGETSQPESATPHADDAPASSSGIVARPVPPRPAPLAVPRPGAASISPAVPGRAPSTSRPPPLPPAARTSSATPQPPPTAASVPSSRPPPPPWPPAARPPASAPPPHAPVVASSAEPSDPIAPVVALPPAPLESTAESEHASEPAFRNVGQKRLVVRAAVGLALISGGFIMGRVTAADPSAEVVASAARPSSAEAPEDKTVAATAPGAASPSAITAPAALAPAAPVVNGPPPAPVASAAPAPPAAPAAATVRPRGLARPEGATAPPARATRAETVAIPSIEGTLNPIVQAVQDETKERTEKEAHGP